MGVKAPFFNPEKVALLFYFSSSKFQIRNFKQPLDLTQTFLSSKWSVCHKLADFIHHLYSIIELGQK